MKRLVLPLIILIVALGIWLYVNKQEEQKVSGSVTRDFLNLDCEKVNRIVISSPVENLTLIKQAEKWFIQDAIPKLADFDAVNRVLQHACTLSVGGVYSNNPEMQQNLMVSDDEGTKVSFYEGEVLLSSVIIGKPTPGYANAYLRQAGSNDVYVVPALFSFAFNMTRGQWMDKFLVRTTIDSVASLDFFYPDKSLSIKRKPVEGEEGPEWAVYEKGLDKGFDALSSRVFPLLQQAATLRAMDMVTEADTGKIDFEPLGIKLIVNLLDGTSDTVEFAQIPPGDMPKRYYARKPDALDTFVVPNMVFEIFTRDVEDLAVPR